ncbi:hypothetical protein ENSA5_02670 [Enhygromyxa salina]|uniref:Uncharacterized protein n=1 Tax=Enhygromyxa salina TaxID=215803 RepID=A0A2S9YK95_9BACT|nr:hypothetical protein [Enhygromyxa salina]PRQ05446.1 hypothetical protein ENSA5_02670 [Enhygromyxa salina]
MPELSREVMAALALAVFWIHVLLIAGAAWLDLRDLIGLRRALRPSATPVEGALGLARGVVRRGDGPGQTLARNVVEQIGRGKGEGLILFNDAAHRSEVFGGEVELDDGTRIEIGAVAGVVWPDRDARDRAAAPSSSDQVAEVEGQARRAKGFRREVEVRVGVGQRVWVGGRFTQAKGWRLEPGVAGSEGEAVLISASELDPRQWLGRRCWLIVGFILADLAIAAGCTVLALWPPLFDWVSMIGAGAALGFFLGVQPLGVSLNEGVRTPDRAYLRGSWSR